MANDEQATPQIIFDKLNKVFKFKLDAAASKSNAKCKKYFTKKDDALSIPWKTKGYVWLNPPYSVKAGPISTWLIHANQAVLFDCCGVICLIPADVSTKHFRYCFTCASEIVFLTPRIAFGKNTLGAKFSSMLAIFNHEAGKRISLWDWQKTDFEERK